MEMENAMTYRHYRTRSKRFNEGMMSRHHDVQLYKNVELHDGKKDGDVQ